MPVAWPPSRSSIGQETDRRGSLWHEAKAKSGWHGRETTPPAKPEGQTVVISAFTEHGHNTTDARGRPVVRHEDNTFKQRSDAIKADTHLVAHTEEQFINNLVEASKKGPIKKLIVLSHSGYQGIFMNNEKGLYASSVAKIKELMKPGPNGELPKIRFAPNATIIFTGCGTAVTDDDLREQMRATGQTVDPSVPLLPEKSFLKTLSEAVPDAEIIGATGKTTPKTRGGSDTNIYSTDGVWHVFRDGKVIRTFKKVMDPSWSTFGYTGVRD
jgi:hypothetical protein